MAPQITLKSNSGFLITHARTITHESGERTDAISINGEDLEVSDGHHTMDELYRHRFNLFIALAKSIDKDTLAYNKYKVWKSKFHSDGTMFEGWFILVIQYAVFDGVKQISYHLPLDYWNKINVVEMERSTEWDGHNSDDVLERLLEL